MRIIDSHGAAHDTSTGRYTSRGYRDADGSLLTPVKHPELTVIEDLILDQHPTAAVAYLADSAPGTGTQNNRLDMILDADGNILWDYMTLDNNRSVAKKNSDQAMLYPIWRMTHELTETGELDDVLPVTDEPLRRNYPPHRRPRALALTPRPVPPPFAIDKIDVDEDYFNQFPIGGDRTKTTFLQRLLRPLTRPGGNTPTS